MLLKEAVKLFVGSTRIVLAGYEVEVIAPHVIALMQQAQRTGYLRITAMGDLHALPSFQKEGIGIFLLKLSYDSPPPLRLSYQY